MYRSETVSLLRQIRDNLGKKKVDILHASQTETSSGQFQYEIILLMYSVQWPVINCKLKILLMLNVSLCFHLCIFAMVLFQLDPCVISPHCVTNMMCCATVPPVHTTPCMQSTPHTRPVSIKVEIN